MGTWYYHSIVTEMGVHPDEAMQRTAVMTRDKNRTPMQWANNPNAGFSPADVKTWLPVNPNYADGINVKDQYNNPNSLLNYYKHLLRVRKQTPALIEGDFTPLNNTAKDYFAFLRKTAEQTVLVVLNFSEKKLELNLSRTRELKGHELQVVFSSAGRANTAQDPKSLHIGSFEVYIAEVK
jgi:glycosidase